MKNLLSKILITGLILGSLIPTLSAQESMSLQFMKGMPQSNLMNPALHNDSSKIVVGIPGMSGVYYDFNSGFAIDDFMHKGTGLLADSLVLDLDKFQGSLSSSNHMHQQFSLPIFYLGFRNKRSFFSFGISEKAMAQLSFDKSLVNFLVEGNAEYMGKTQNLGNLDMDAFQYREYALGYSYETLSNKLTIGLKTKLLFGKFAFQTEQMHLSVETAVDGSYLNLNSDMKINMSAPVNLEYDSDNYFSGAKSDGTSTKEYLLEGDNKGLAFDLGAVYKLTPKITFSGSVIDLGKISFTNKTVNFDHVSTYKWEGIDFSKSIDKGSSDYVKPSDLFETEFNKLKDTFRPAKSEFSSEAFNVTIPTKVYLGGTYDINRQFNVGLLDRMYFYDGNSQNTFTLSANAMFLDFLSLTGSYSFVGNSSNNLGLGLAIRAGFVQIYAVSDNVIAVLDPAKAEFANARFGISFLFGRKKTIKNVDQSVQ
jgi:hypothetical protein